MNSKMSPKNQNLNNFRIKVRTRRERERRANGNGNGDHPIDQSTLVRGAIAKGDGSGGNGQSHVRERALCGAAVAPGPDERQRAMTIVAEEYCQGKTFAECRDILRERLGLSLSIPTVYTYMKKVRAMWRTKANDAYDIMVNRECARLDMLETTAWDALEHSFDPRMVEVKKISQIMVNVALAQKVLKMKGRRAARAIRMMKVKVPAKRKMHQFTKESLNGDPRWAMIIADCIRQRRELLGLDKPKDVNVRFPDLENASDQQLIERVRAAGERITAKGLLPAATIIDITADLGASRDGKENTQ